MGKHSQEDEHTALVTSLCPAVQASLSDKKLSLGTAPLGGGPICQAFKGEARVFLEPAGS